MSPGSTRGEASRYSSLSICASCPLTQSLLLLPPSRQLPWKQLHQSTPHLPHSPTTHFPSLTTSSSFLTTPLGGHPHTSTTMAMFGDGGKGRQDGREKRRRQKPLHPRPKRSNFLQVSNTLSSPPPRTVPAGLRGVANSIGNHYHGNQTAHLAREGGVMPANEVSRVSQHVWLCEPYFIGVIVACLLILFRRRQMPLSLTC